MKKFVVAVSVAMAAFTLAPGAFAQEAAPAAAHAGAMSTSTTPVGQMLDNPGARAVLEQHIPEVVANPLLQQGLQMTLAEIQQYEPILTAEKLAAIDAALAALPH